MLNDRYFPKQYIYIFLGIMLLWGLTGMSAERLMSLLYVIPGIVIGTTFHEFAHAYVAMKLGDDTPVRQGRVTLNPIKHLDPIGTIMLLFAGFGWGKPVEVDPKNFRRDISMEKGNAIVSIAGPIASLIVAIVLMILSVVIYKFVGLSNEIVYLIYNMLVYGSIINVALAIFNMIPLPPLDGSKVIRPILPYKAKQWLDKNERIFYMVFILIYITGVGSIIISPLIETVHGFLLKLVMSLFGM